MDPFLDAYARVVVEHALELEPGQTVLIESTTTGQPLCDAIHRRALIAGAQPTLILAPDGANEARLECASDEALGSPDWLRELIYARVERRVKVIADQNTRGSSGLAPERVALGWKGYSAALRLLLQRDARGEARWCAAQYPTEAFAQEAGLSLEDYRDALSTALLLDRPDPVAAWRAVAARQERIRAFLEGVDELRFVAEGTDLRLRVGGRSWVSAHGTHNLPDGEVFTGPHEDATEGTVRFSFPAVWEGRVATGVRLRFEQGRCVESSADSGEDFVQAALALDEGAAVLGEVALGLNDGVTRPMGDTLFDEKLGGSFHLALGASYAETGGVNDSALHWDMVCDLREGGELYADGRLVQRDGRFLTELGLD